MIFKGLAMALLVLPFAATAASGIDVEKDRPFPEQKAEVQAALADGETYAEINPQDRSAVLGALERIEFELESAGGIDVLDREAQVRVFNDQELVNNLLTRAGEDSRLVCRRSRKVGSHFPTNVCQTVAEQRRLREASQDQMKQLNSHRMLPPGG
ncbi:hypothetical protein [Novilysobacter spongiicola]|uniref:Secreted protein n=1 Tax=Lysobacter spongiicola DSM 21749 TaxID=1122188 RepID=A0A1T4LGR9_9GAMM|nr:hypothetical protein [Lysobacter spongiicola]SJZ53925.1 hypothetical protein SAMN02745674_00010 [Lysobacter spongiicola DSM 21749]